MPKHKRLRKKSSTEQVGLSDSSKEDKLELFAELFPDDEEDSADDLSAMSLFSSTANKKQSLAESDKLKSQDEVIAQPALIERGFTSEDQNKLSQNEHMRFMNNSDKVAHALVTKDKNGKIITQQFTAPGSSDPTDPTVVGLKNIEIFEDRYGNRHARATAEDGTEMISKRSVDVQTTDQHGKDIEHELLLFSPKASHIWRGDVFWGSNPRQKPNLFSDKLSDRQKKELQKEMSEAKEDIRGGEIELVNSDVVKREDMKRNPTQNKVMGQSAVDAYDVYYDTYKDELSDDMKAIIQKSTDARPNVRSMGPKGQPRPEWLHALGFGLYPMTGDPQTASNLGAAPKWLNTKMMTTERALKWHAMHRPESKLTLNCRYKMLPHSDIIDEGKITGTFVEGDNQVVLSQHLNPHQKYPVFSKPTDLMQTTLVTHQLLSNKTPAAVKEAKIETRLLRTYPIVTQAGGYAMGGAVQVEAASQGSSSSSNMMPAIQKIDDITTIPNVPLSSAVLDLPTTFSHEKSVVKIFSTFQEADYEMPWLGSIPNKCTGSGFVIEENGRHYVMTNAHVVDASNYLEVRLANDDRVFTATVKQVCHQGDMALLEIEDEEFQAITEPVIMGEMAQMQAEVKAVGFPMGGEELSITKGIVSRIEVDIYAQSGERMLQVQTDSAINPGNSGGPVFCEGKLAGIAFQGNDRGEGLGYFIPTPMVQHFLRDAFSGAEYKGFATLNIALQPLTNPGLRDYFGLSAKQTGVRVTTVDALSDIKDKILQDDIILAIDGIKVGNDAKVTVPEVGSRLDLNYLFQRKHIGDQVTLTILRKNQETQDVQQMDVTATLKWRPGQTKKVEAPEHEKDPTYYIKSGIIFQPLTNNFLETRKGAVLANVIIPTVGYISDIPKKALGEQFVVINSVLDSKKTSGYGDFECALVDEINGVKIRNIKDVVQAMEPHKGSHHKIKLIDQDIIVLENISAREHHKLLKRYRIHDDRSNDLKILDDMSSVMPAKAGRIAKIVSAIKPKKKTKKVTFQVEDSDTSLLDSLSDLLSASDFGSDAELDVANDLFNGGGSSDDEYDYNDPFIVDDEEAESQKGYKNLMGDYRISKQSMLQMADKSGKDFTMSELSFMHTIDRIAKRAGVNAETSFYDSEEDSDFNSSSESELESESDSDIEDSLSGKQSHSDSDDEGSPQVSPQAATGRRSRRQQGLNP